MIVTEKARFWQGLFSLPA